MPRYKVICFPSARRYETIVEANEVSEAIDIATDEANKNCEYYADQEDVTEL